ncbi:MAG: 1-acyl-sn-glycerol-3-phosphate acyltransferase [Cyanobium sp.]
MPNASGLPFLPPRFDARVVAAARLLLPLWLRSHGLRRFEVDGMEQLQEVMEEFQSGRNRLLLAFRHPSLDDPAVLARLLWHDLHRAGRRRFRPRPHAQFLYDRGIPLWAGAPMGWLLSRLGGCSIQRGALDLPALRSARGLLLDGPHPFAVAPEGATNGHNELISPLEPGVAQLALWTADDLEKAGRTEATLIVPLGVQYAFLGPVWPAIEALLHQLETEAGLAPPAGRTLAVEHLQERLLRLCERILDLMERFYQQLPRPWQASGSAAPRRPPVAAASARRPDAAAAPSAEALQTPAATPLEQRLDTLLETALQVAEQALAVEPHGDRSSRCRRLEQAGWERLYPANGSALAATGTAPGPAPSALERSLAARLAEDTQRSLWHMRLVESFVAVSGHYVRDCPSQERFADTLWILWDTLGRIRDGTPGQRPRLGPRQSLIRIGSPIDVGPRLGGYRADRRGAVASLTADLQRQMEALIVPSAPPLQAAASRAR